MESVQKIVRKKEYCNQAGGGWVGVGGGGGGGVGGGGGGGGGGRVKGYPCVSMTAVSSILSRQTQSGIRE